MSYDCKKMMVTSKFLNHSVPIIIALPNSFDKAKAYSIYLVFDGNDLLDTSQENILSNNHSNKIFIGISCENNVERFNNWSTYQNQKVLLPMKKRYPNLLISSHHLGGNALNFIKFITNELLILIQHQQKIVIKDLNLLGCSMAAYFSLQILYLSELKFKKALLFSPSIWFNENILNDLAKMELNKNINCCINLWVGLKEPKMFERSFNVDYYQDSVKVKKILEQKANVNITLTVDENGGHGFKWWIKFLNNHQEWW